ncbi:MAG: mechanosensitive ion channel family protein [Bradymonadia bacterium]
MKDDVGSLTDRLQATVMGWVESVVAAAPKVLLGILLVVVALMVSKLARKFLGGLLKRIKIDEALVKAGLDAPLKRLGLAQPSEWMPRVAHALLLFLFAGAAADALGLDAVAAAMGRVLDYLPNVLAALVLVVAGSWAGQTASAVIRRATEASSIDFGPALARFVSGMVVFVFALTAVGQLKIDTEIVRIFTACALGAMGIAFGLSMGLGSKDITRNILAGFYARKLFKGGETLTLGQHTGQLDRIEATQTLLRTDDGLLTLPNTVFLDLTVKAGATGKNATGQDTL